MRDQEMKSKAELLVEKVAMTAETYYAFHDREKAMELASRAWWVVNKRYFDDRERLMQILLRHCQFAFTQSRVVPDRILNKVD
jgi:hypothetical protein